MTPRAFELSCVRLWGGGRGAPSAYVRICRKLSITLDEFLAFKVGALPIPESIERLLNKEMRRAVRHDT